MLYEPCAAVYRGSAAPSRWHGSWVGPAWGIGGRWRQRRELAAAALHPASSGRLPCISLSPARHGVGLRVAQLHHAARAARAGACGRRALGAAQPARRLQRAVHGDAAGALARSAAPADTTAGLPPPSAYAPPLPIPCTASTLRPPIRQELHSVLALCEHPRSMLVGLPPDFPRVIVLTGAGRAFCGGVDIKARLCGPGGACAAWGAAPHACLLCGRLLVKPHMQVGAPPRPAHDPPPRLAPPRPARRPQTRASAARPGTIATCAASSC